MRYTINAQANGPGGCLLSLALVREDGHSLYLVVPERPTPLAVDIEERVWQARLLVPPGVLPIPVAIQAWAYRLSLFLLEDPEKKPAVYADCPGNVAHLCELLREGWRRASINPLQLDLHPRQVRTWPNSLIGAIRYNAWWEAYALGRRLDFRGLARLPPPQGADRRVAR